MTSSTIETAPAQTTPAQTPPVRSPASTAIDIEDLDKLLNRKKSKVEKASTIQLRVDELSPLVKKCLQRLMTAAISYGSISLEAHKTVASAANQILMALQSVSSMKELLKRDPRMLYPRSNSGEGGELSERNGTLEQSLARQVASGRFGVNSEYLNNALELQVKAAQGVKPGEGGILLSIKVTPGIARARMTEPYTDLKSPPPHHDIYSVEDLKQLIRDLRQANPRALISVKLAAIEDIGEIAVAVVKCGADNIVIAGPGGTGAVNTEVKYNTPRPWEPSLAKVHQVLIENGLREKVTLTASGGLQTGEDIAMALFLGSDYVEVGTAPLVGAGCVMARVCHDGTCPAGIATTDQENIEKNFEGTPESVAEVLIGLAEALASTLENYGIEDPAEAVGKTELLSVKEGTPLEGLEVLLKKSVNPFKDQLFPTVKSDLTSEQENAAISLIQQGQKDIVLKGGNEVISFAARIGHHYYQNTQFKQTMSVPVRITFQDNSGRKMEVGQSFGAFAPPNLVLVASHAQDGVGKGLSAGSTIILEELAGDSVGYGATGGTIIVRQAGGRAGVRNSHGRLIFGQIGDCGANFMTGGRLTVFGSPENYPITFRYANNAPLLFNAKSVGPNFGSGLSGGTVILPKKLYDELREQHYLADAFEKISPEKLNETEKSEVEADLKQYANHIPQDKEWVGELLQTQDWDQHFVKLKPAPSPVPAAKKTKQKEVNLIAPKSPLKMQPSQIGNGLALASAIRASSHHDTGRLQQGRPENREHDACGMATFVNLKDESSRETTDRILGILPNLEHRGATGVDPETGDGCGILWYGLDAFFHSQFSDLDLKKDKYAVIPMSQGEVDANEARALLAEMLETEGLSIAADRLVPVDQGVLGKIAKSQWSPITQFVVKKSENLSQEDFEKQLIRAHLRFELSVQKQSGRRPHIFSASSHYVVYKAMALESRIANYFKDFTHPQFKSRAAVCHARFATNTLPLEMNIQPFKFANNGENNALQLLVRLLAYEPAFKTVLGLEEVDLNKFSDSHIMSVLMDCLDLMGYTLEDILLATIQSYNPQNPTLAVFYDLFGIPFQGPNASAIAMGSKIAMVRDLNGFRPLRACWQEGEWFYAGSELGPAGIFGETFNLPAGQPVIVDLAEGTVSAQLQNTPAVQRTEKLNPIPRLKTLSQSQEYPFVYSQEEWESKRIKAGWDDDKDTNVIRPLMENKKLVASMGDHGTIESLVESANVELGNFLKNKFSEITNPPLAKNEESAYMSTQTFVGRKPTITDMLNSDLQIEGVILPSPIVNNRELAALLAHFGEKTQVIDMGFNIEEGEAGFRNAMQTVVNAAIDAVKRGCTFIVLSDLNNPDQNASLPPVLIASVVDQALLKAGLRRQASIALQAASILMTRDVAQAISVGGADIVNPYLPMTPVKGQTENIERTTPHYQENLRQGLLGFMAQMGISTVSAYRGTKGFGAQGLDAELSGLLGVRSTFSGFGIQQLANAVCARHWVADKKGSGKFGNIATSGRELSWKPGHAKRFLQSLRDNVFSGSPRGQLRLADPTAWTAKNPMPVCILGAGAAGMYLARELLSNTTLPIKIIFIEKNPANNFGLLGDGVAPDHANTKKQSATFASILQDSRVEYYGGVDVDGEGPQAVKLEELNALYPCLVDCRGAAVDRKLGVKGEESSRIIPASTVYKTYNAAFQSHSNEERQDWPFSASKNPTIGIFGGGNVVADIARILLSNVDTLRETGINPQFLDTLEKRSPQVVQIFVRGEPSQIKITWPELRELQKLHEEGVINLTASFDEAYFAKPLDQLSDEERKLYDFFVKYKNNPAIRGKKQLQFHFQVSPVEFIENGQDISSKIKKPDGSYQEVAARNFVVAVGTQPGETSSLISYRSGWALGKGGTLVSAQDTAKQTAADIATDFKAKKFNKPSSLSAASANRKKKPLWQTTCPTKKSDLQIQQAQRQAGKTIRTPAELSQVQDSFQGSAPVPRSHNANEPKKPAIGTQPNTLRIESNGIVIEKSLPEENRNFLDFLKEILSAGNEPKARCEGQGTCSECLLNVLEIEDDSRLKADDFYKLERSLLACRYNTDDFRGLGALLRVSSPRAKKKIEMPAPKAAAIPS